MIPSLHLGFEVGTGKPVEIPCRHMVVTGQTQEAGKTTTLEALISRSGLPAVAFVTKRGEQSFDDARRIEPYFRERADWQFVASVLEATMRERLKFERAWIMRASKGARTLADVHANRNSALGRLPEERHLGYGGLEGNTAPMELRRHLGPLLRTTGQTHDHGICDEGGWWIQSSRGNEGEHHQIMNKFLQPKFLAQLDAPARHLAKSLARSRKPIHPIRINIALLDYAQKLREASKALEVLCVLTSAQVEFGANPQPTPRKKK
jgi:hypothetical protein